MGYNIGPTIAVNGEKEYMNAMKNIRSEMKQVKAAADAATSAYSKNDKSIEALTTRNNELKKAYEVQEKAVKAAESVLERYKEKGLDPTSKAYLDMETNLNNAKAALNKTSVEIRENEAALEEQSDAAIAAARAIEEQEEAARRAEEEQKKYEEAVNTLNDTLNNVANTGLVACTAEFTAISAAVVAGVKGLYDMSAAAADVADDLLTTSAQTGVSVEMLQEYGYAARFIDTELDVLTNTMAKNIKSMKAAQDGTKLSVDAYNALGIAVTDADGKLRDGQTVYWEVIDALGKMENETQRDAIAMQILGKSAQEVNPLIKAGSSAVSEYANEAHALGIVLDDEAIAALGRYDDALETVSAQMDGLKNSVSAQLAPYFESAAKTISEAMKRISDSVKNGALKPSIDKIGKSIEKMAIKAADAAEKWIPKLASAFEWLVDNSDQLVGGLISMIAAFATLKTTLSVMRAIDAMRGVIAALTTVTTAQTTATTAATAAQTGLNTAMAANPIGMVVAAVAALVAGLVAFAGTSAAMSESLDTLENQMEETNKQAEESAAAFESAMDAIDDSEESTTALVDRLDELAKKTKRSAAEQAELEGIIAELNDRVDGLGLAYDENTGMLNKNISSVRDMIQARYDEARANELVQRGIQLLTEQKNRQQDHTRAVEEAKKAAENYEAAEKRLNDTAENNKRKREAATGALIVYKAAAEDAVIAEETAAAALAETNAQIAANEEELNGLLGTVSEATENEIPSFVYANYDLSDAIASVGISAEEAEGKISQYADYTQNAFEKISQNAALSVSDLIGNLTSNQETIERWTNDLASLGGKIDEGLISKLRELGPEYANTVSNIANATPEELSELNAAWEKGGSDAVEAFLREIGSDAMINSGSETVDKIAAGMESNTKLDEAAVIVVENAEVALSDAINNAGFDSYGESISQGIASGITNGTSAVESAVRSVVNAALIAAQRASDTHSPSRLFRDKIGKMWGEGIKVGFIESMAEMADTMGRAVDGVVASMPSSVATNDCASPIINLTVTDPSPAYMDYLFNKFNVKLGAMV